MGRKIILYSAVSLDGFIARKNGNVDWLPSEGDFGYKEFYDGVDTTIMGNTTFKQILTFGEFPYKGKRNIVLTLEKNDQPVQYVEFLSNDICANVEILKKQSGKDIWLIGGGKVNAFFLKNDLVDELDLFLIPVLIGDGIRLFDDDSLCDRHWSMIESKTYKGGVIRARYNKRVK